MWKIQQAKSVLFLNMTEKKTNFWVHVSPGSAETLARGNGITNDHLIAYSLSIISAKKKLPKSDNVH